MNNANLDSTDTFWQILDESDTRSDKIKQKLARLMWAIGTTNRQGVEKIYPMIAGLENTDGVQITYNDMVKRSTPKFKDRRYDDIFAAVNIGYAYDAGSDKNSQSINVTNVDQDAYDPSYVTGIEDEQIKQELWNYGNTLYNVYGVLNEFPAELQDCGWIQTEAQAIEYVRNCYKWQGVYLDPDLDVPTGKQRYIATFRVPWTFGIDNGLDVGSKIQLSVKNKTWDGPVEVYHSGIITAVTDTFGVATPVMDITAEMLGGNLSGSDRFIIVKGTDESTVDGDTSAIVKGTDSTTAIVKGTL